VSEELRRGSAADGQSGWVGPSSAHLLNGLADGVLDGALADLGDVGAAEALGDLRAAGRGGGGGGL
jgi:hypothetical protein